jgi:putative exosortase-associated protein (TIGR04073 family)
MRKVVILVIAGIMLFSFIAPIYAQNPIIKLGRGVVNTLSGWLEIAKQPYETTKQENLLAGCTVGIVKGLGMGLLRTGVGLWDLLTFPIPAPAKFEPILKPEFVFSGSEIVTAEQPAPEAKTK